MKAFGLRLLLDRSFLFLAWPKALSRTASESLSQNTIAS